MNDVQVALTADLIIDRFYYLKLEEIKLCFRNAMASGKIYDRLDGNIILGWLNEYDAQRDVNCFLTLFNLMKPMNKIITALECLRRIYQTSKLKDRKMEMKRPKNYWNPINHSYKG